MTRSVEAIAAELGSLRQEVIAPAEAVLEKAYPRRLALFQEARAAGMTHRAIAEADGTAETAVVAALRKARVKAEASG